MNVVELIDRKKERSVLSAEEIRYLVDGYTRGSIPDYQFAAFLMAVRLNGMTLRETADLTASMLASGRQLDLSFLRGPKIDKHSTGGVGDKISIILAPLVAACGVYVPMISGRGLGHTGGTLDKLESIPGFRTGLSRKEMLRVLEDVGCFISGTSAELVPADRKIYALRDVTATVDSIPLITASIMSKKLAEDIDGLVVDVKYGNGAFMVQRQDAVRLGRWMTRVGGMMGRRVRSVVTSMEQPTGRMVGNSLEVWESIRALKGDGEPDVLELVLRLGAEMLLMAGRADNRRQACYKLQALLETGKAFDKFREMVGAQGGDVGCLGRKQAFVRARYQYEVRAGREGYVAAIDARGMGLAAIDIGAGRRQLGERIEHAAGFEVTRKVGRAVGRADPLVTVHSEHRLEKEFLSRVRKLFKITQDRPRGT